MVSHTKNSERPKQPSSSQEPNSQNGKTSTYTKQADIERVIQKQCEYHFTLAHRAPTTKHTIGAKLTYLSDKEVARSIIEGTYNIPTDLDDATKLILEDIGNLGMKLRNKEGQ